MAEVLDGSCGIEGVLERLQKSRELRADGLKLICGHKDPPKVWRELYFRQLKRQLRCNVNPALTKAAFTQQIMAGQLRCP